MKGTKIDEDDTRLCNMIKPSHSRVKRTKPLFLIEDKMLLNLYCDFRANEAHRSDVFGLQSYRLWEDRLQIAVITREHYF